MDQRSATRPESPPWFSLFMQATYFKDCRCRQHTRSREQKFFCVDCANGPFCNFKIDQEHGNHRTLQVRKCTRQDSIKTDDLAGLLSIADVQVYSFNGAAVVYLHRRPQDQLYANDEERDAHHARKSLVCFSCPRGLLSGTYHYCCIACKFSIEPANGPVPAHNSLDIASTSSQKQERGRTTQINLQIRPSLHSEANATHDNIANAHDETAAYYLSDLQYDTTLQLQHQQQQLRRRHRRKNDYTPQRSPMF
ncbi:hypothetical protein GOP47_0003340 [Adiantum capillus-veneris]|uniref:Uncharacterized protein n=1 Tax=Adiantum capillus-veneris TaxID=13818 RepID=A0A9D4VCA4_ADICA|nr:hypothetical protein GOP47_0003340 [Adiantum capillus-veneris]